CQRPRDITIHNSHTPGSYCADPELFKTGHTKLAHDENIERNTKRLRDFVSDRHSAARKAEHDHVVASGIFRKLHAEQSSGFDAIRKNSFHAVTVCPESVQSGERLRQSAPSLQDNRESRPQTFHGAATTKFSRLVDGSRHECTDPNLAIVRARASPDAAGTTHSRKA